MKLNDYQDDARATCLDTAKNIPYLVTGLTAEAGEVAGKFAKYLRDGNGLKDFLVVEKEMIKELGDVLWFVAILSEELGVTLEQVAQQNIDKLYSRKQRGVLKGNGDDR